MKKILLLVIAIVLFASCSEKEIDATNLVERNGKTYKINSDKTYSGKVIKKSENGQFIFVGQYDDGLKNGKWINYFSNGQISSTTNYSKGKLNGLKEVYNKSGQLISKGNYDNDKKNGEFLTFYDDGKNKFKGNYISGKQDGIIEKWYENGQERSKITFSEGELNGSYKEFSKSGYLKIECNYKNGILDGQYTKWYTKDTKQKVLQYVNGTVKSEKKWNSDGTVWKKASPIKQYNQYYKQALKTLNIVVKHYQSYQNNTMTKNRLAKWKSSIRKLISIKKKMDNLHYGKYKNDKSSDLAYQHYMKFSKQLTREQKEIDIVISDMIRECKIVTGI